MNSGYKEKAILTNQNDASFTPIYTFGSCDPLLFLTRRGLPHTNRVTNEFYTVPTLWNDIKSFFARVKSYFVSTKKLDPETFCCAIPRVEKYVTFSGVDVKLYIGTEGKEPERLVPAQALSHGIDFDQNRVAISLICALFAESNYYRLHGHGALQLKLVANNEYGIKSEMYFNNVSLKTMSSGVSIDDIIVEEQFTLECKPEDIVPWKKIETE